MGVEKKISPKDGKYGLYDGKLTECKEMVYNISMTMEASAARKASEEIYTTHQQKIRYEGVRGPTLEELRTLEQARKIVIEYLQFIGSAEGVGRMKKLELEKIRIYENKFFLYEGKWHEIRVQGHHAFDNIQEFPRQTVESPVFLHVSVHEFFHHASHGRSAFVETADGNYVRKASGISTLPIGRNPKEALKKIHFVALNEAATETLTRYSLPEDAIVAHGGFYDMYRFLLQILLRKIVLDRSASDPSFGLKEAWHIFQEDYFSGTHKFLSEVQKSYGKDMPKMLANFGKSRDTDLELLEKVHPSSEEDFSGEYFYGHVVLMVEGNDSKATQELNKFDAELRALVAPRKNPSQQ